MKNLIKTSILLIFFFIGLNSCSSLREVKLKENPGFEKNAKKFGLSINIFWKTG
jgi:hypothetical protein